MIFSVYRLTCKTSGKSYIGLTNKSADRRWMEHVAAARRGVNFNIHHAIRKYGEDNWTVETVDQFPDKKLAADLERKLIREENTIQNGYNMTAGGDGLLGLRRTPEWCAKIAVANSVPCTEEKKAKLRKYKGSKSSFYGKKHSKETKEKMSRSSSGELHPGYGRRGEKHHQAKTYIITHKDGREEMVTGLSNYCRENPDFNKTGWHKVLSGKAETYKGCKIKECL